MGKKDKNPTPSVLGSKGILAGIIIIALIISSVGFLFITGNAGGTPAVPPNECGKAVILYANANLISASNASTLVSVTEKNGMYLVESRSSARSYGFYVTKDCNLLFINPYNLKSTPTPASSPKTTTSPKPTTSPTPVPEPVKSSRPSIELFVMSFCPFGVQAENAMAPVVDLLGAKADITVHYIATVNGDTFDSVKSLHGPTEAKEDLRQLCIAKYYPQELWPYLVDFNKNCEDWNIRKDAISYNACLTNTTRNLGIDNQKIDTCAGDSEGSRC